MNDDTNDNSFEFPVRDQLTMEKESLSADAAIVRNIAGFLTLSDAASIATGFGLDTPTVDGWAVGETPQEWSVDDTPGLVALSPDPDDDLPDLQLEDSSDMMDGTNGPQTTACWAQEKLATAVFSHPQSLRSYCVDAFEAAKDVKVKQNQSPDDSPETQIEPIHPKAKKRGQRQPRNDRIVFITAMVDHIINNIPLSVALDVLDGVWELSLDTSFAAVRITSMTFQGIVDAVLRCVMRVWDGVTQFSPVAMLQMILSTGPFSAMGKTREVVVSGIQSVATGVGSAGSLALHRLSVKTGSSSSLAQQSALRRNRLSSPQLNKKLLQKLSSMHSAASVISYTEIGDDMGGLSRRAKSRVQRMMHYEVSLRPFVATVQLPATGPKKSSSMSLSENDESESSACREVRSPEASPPGSPFMCTPRSFPPTPNSRRMVLARGTRFSDDVVFLARDQLRVHDALESENERTREMAVALTQGKRLAVFDADDASAGIELTCGQHVAKKVGNLLYCSARSMVPLLRNCYVYFEMSVLPKPGSNLIMPTLSVGLSTKEMPPNTLVGAWKGSVGLCTTGQMLTAGQWCSSVDHTMNAFGDGATVGCLVCLDDGSAFETWDGVMVTAAVTFNVNQRIVSPPVMTLPMGAGSNACEGSEMDAMASQIPPPQTGPPAFTLPLLVPAEEELFPTVTLHSPGTAVMCRFSAGDALATTREGIGAPPGVTVYGVDGSVVLTELD